MAKTYRNNADGSVRTDGGRTYATPRYRPGSRRKPRRIIVTPVRRETPDLERFGRAIIDAAMTQAALETAAAREATGSDGDTSGAGTDATPETRDA